MTLIQLAFAVPREGANGTTVFFVQMMIFVAIIYFLLLRPQAKERQRHETMLGAIKKGDEIVTNGGIIGKVVHVDEKRLTIRTGENTKLTVDRARIASVLDVKGEPKED